MGRSFFVLLFVLTIPLGFLEYVNKREEEREFFRVISFGCVCLLILFVAFLREPLLGVDGLDNYNAFNKIYTGVEKVRYEIGYLTLVRLAQLITTNYRFFIIMCGCLIYIPIFYVVSHFQYRTLILQLFILSMYNATFDVLKGALSFAVLLLGVFLIEYKKKYIWGVVLTGVALSIHIATSMFVVIFVVAYFMKKKRDYIIITILCVLMSIPVVSENLFRFVVYLASFISPRFKKYGIEGIDTYFSTTYFLFYLVIMFIVYLYYKRLARASQANKVLININYLVFLGSFSFGWFPHVTRYLKFSMLFSAIILSECLSIEQDKRKKVILVFSSMLLFVMFSFINNGGFLYY